MKITYAFLEDMNTELVFNERGQYKEVKRTKAFYKKETQLQEKKE